MLPAMLRKTPTPSEAEAVWEAAQSPGFFTVTTLAVNGFGPIRVGELGFVPLEDTEVCSFTGDDRRSSAM